MGASVVPGEMTQQAYQKALSSHPLPPSPYPGYQWAPVDTQEPKPDIDWSEINRMFSVS